MNSYELSRDWFDWCFDNPEKINPNHTAMYFFIIEHCNRLGWKEKFGLPMQMTKDAIGISNYRTFSKTFNDLVDWGFLKVHQKSKNQYSSNIIGIVKNTKAKSKALDKAMQNHSQKQVHGIVGIDKQLNNKTIKPFKHFAHLSISVEEHNKLLEEYSEQDVFDIYESIENYKKNTQYKSLYLTAKKWLAKEKSSAKKESNEPKVGRMTQSDAEKTIMNFANATIPGLNNGR